MTRRIGRLGVVVGATLIAAASVALAHDPAKKSAGMHGMECGEHHSAAMKASDDVSMHLAEAKRSTTLAEMRSHVEMADKAMASMKEHMSMCMEMMDKTHHGMMKDGNGMMGGGMMSGKPAASTTATKAVDPVCGMEVDPAKASSAIYKGNTYYFCSDEDKAKFQKNPEQYVPKKG